MLHAEFCVRLPTIISCSVNLSKFLLLLVNSVLKVLEKTVDAASSDHSDHSYSDDHSYSAGCVNSSSASVSNPVLYRLTEQFVIKVQKDDEPAVWFYSVLFVDLLSSNYISDCV